MDDKDPEGPIPKQALKSYVSGVFQQSTISAVSNIAAAQNNCSKVFRSGVFLLCLIGFIYQCVVFLEYVLQFPTVVDVDIDKPGMTEVPAFTFCNSNGILRSKYCAKYPDRCVEADESYCQEHPKMCESNYTLIPHDDYHITELNMTIEDFLELGQSLRQFLLPDQLDDDDEEKLTGPFIRTKHWAGFGRLGCYSLNSVVNTTDDVAQQYWRKQLLNKPFKRFVFDVQPNETFTPFVRPGVYFAIHSAVEAVNPIETGIFMEPGKVYKMVVTMEQEVLMEFPYETDCKNYTKMILKSNKEGPRMQEMCLQKCFLELSIGSWNCVHASVLYPYTENICSVDIEMDPPDLPQEEIAKYFSCKDTCKDDCSKMRFSHTVHERYASDFFMERMRWAELHRYVIMEVYLENPEVVTYRHVPQYRNVEVFSYLGGFVGIWLGISLIQVADFLESILRITVFSYKRRNEK